MASEHDKKVVAEEVCAKCRAARGAACRGLRGQALANPHNERKKAARKRAESQWR